jgi:hypothetical protein
MRLIITVEMDRVEGDFADETASILRRVAKDFCEGYEDDDISSGQGKALVDRNGNIVGTVRIFG